MVAALHMVGSARPRGNADLVLFAEAVSEATAITWPAGIQAGDLSVLLQYIGDQYSNVIMPGGTTVLFQQPGGGGTEDSSLSASYKICDGTESGPFNTFSNADNKGKVLYIFRWGAGPISSVISSTWSWQGGSGNMNPQTISMAGQPVPIIGLGMCASQFAAAPWGTVSPAWDGTTPSGPNNWATGGYKIYNESPANMSVDMNDVGSSNALFSGYLRVA